MNCMYCYDKAPWTRKIRDTSEVNVISYSVIRETIEALRPTELLFYGGEPLLRKEFVQDVIDEHENLQTRICTNGKLLHVEDLHAFRETGTKIALSIDSPYWEVNRRNRKTQKFIFEHMLDQLQEFSDIMIAVITASPDNGSVSEMVDWCNCMGIKFEINFEFGPIDFDVANSPLVKDIEANPYVLGYVKRGRGKDKFRLHVDGTISRSLLRGHDVICNYADIPPNIDQFGRAIGHKLCRECSARFHCDLNNAFGNIRDLIFAHVSDPATLSVCEMQRRFTEIRRSANVEQVVF